MPHSQQEIDVWSVEGRFSQLIFSPKGAIEGLLIDTDGVLTQFVTDPQDRSVTEQLAGLHAGQALVLEGSLAEPSPKGEPPHVVYDFDRLVSVDGKESTTQHREDGSTGVVVRFNYAKHGNPNGVVLDNGDFIHTKPDGLKKLGLKVGDQVKVKGEAKPLVTGTGRVIEAQKVNGVKL